MKTLLATVTIAVAILSSCSLSPLTGDEKNVQLVPVLIADEYSMDIPSYMTKTTLLNDDASLQFQNIFKEAYVIVIDESKQDFIDALVDADRYDSARSVVANYADTQIQFISDAMNVLDRTNLVKLKINGLSAIRTEMDGSVEGVATPISYFVTFIESKEKLYMIMAWTLKDRKERFRATFDKMSRTFKRLHDEPLTMN